MDLPATDRLECELFSVRLAETSVVFSAHRAHMFQIVAITLRVMSFVSRSETTTLVVAVEERKRPHRPSQVLGVRQVALSGTATQSSDVRNSKFDTEQA